MVVVMRLYLLEQCPELNFGHRQKLVILLHFTSFCPTLACTIPSMVGCCILPCSVVHCLLCCLLLPSLTLLSPATAPSIFWSALSSLQLPPFLLQRWFHYLPCSIKYGQCLRSCPVPCFANNANQQVLWFLHLCLQEGGLSIIIKKIEKINK